jgi:hypothetical protein
MSSRTSGHLPRSAALTRSKALLISGEPEIGLIDLARNDGARLECLRSDRPSDDGLLASIAQFDVLSNLAAIDDAHSADPRVFYTNFARFRQDRVQPVVERLLTDPAMRAEIFRGSDAELATALQAVDHWATSQACCTAGSMGGGEAACGSSSRSTCRPSKTCLSSRPQL